MGQNTKIEWAHHTANLWWGCQEVHEGCDHCYARTWDKRMGGDHWGAHAPRRAIKSVWADLAKWQQAAAAAGETHRVFCGSMMDIFEVSKPVVDHRGNPLGMETADLRGRLFHEVVSACPNLLFLFLTKRPQNIRKMVPLTWLDNPPTNIVYGCSAVNQKTADLGIPALLAVPGRHFLSCEPLLGTLDIRRWLPCTRGGPSHCPNIPQTCCRCDDRRDNNNGIDWVIVGGESGHGARPMHPDWARSIRYQCRDAGVPFFFKQWGEWVPQGEMTDEQYNVVAELDPESLGGVRRFKRDNQLVGNELFWKIGKAVAGRLLDGKASTATPETAAPSASFTMNDLLAAYAKLPALPTVFYTASEHVDTVGDMIYKVDNPEAPAGFDIVCRPNQIGDLRETLSGYAILRPLDDAERERRRRKWSEG